MEKELVCGDCNMVFRSTGLLEKHKALFCIGSEVRHPRVRRHSAELLARDKLGCEDAKQTRTPDLVQVRGQRRNMSRWRGTDAKTRTEELPATSQSDSAAVRGLTEEFHKLRMSIEDNLPKWSKRSTDPEGGRQLGHSERLREMREMVTLHERQLALIHAQNQQLEQQRDELANQVSVLSEHRNTAHLESLLMELREQEERNEETLQQLAEHLRLLHVREASVPADQPDPHKKENLHPGAYELTSGVDGPLSTQIKALRQAYLQSGGSDAAIVAQMIDLQVEAQTLERNQLAAVGKKKKATQRGQSWELLAVEQENRRLEEEILRIQLARGHHQNYKAAERSDFELIERENLLQMARLQADMERSREAPRSGKQPPPPSLPLQHKVPAPTRSFPCPLGKCMLDLVDSLGPAPYDPVAGFVVFYDLVMGVDVALRALRLVAAFYSDGQEVGAPTSLPPVQCLLGASLPHTHSLTPQNCALLSVKQPVPRIQPSPSLCLVVEVQAAKDLDVHCLASCGWTQLQVFDQYNQLRSGCWRVPVHSLPVRPTLTISQLNSVPQVANMELCVRLVNGRDADVQTAAKPDPTSTSHYKYPAVVSPLPLPVCGNAAQPVSALQPAAEDQLRSRSPFTDQPAAPRTDEASPS